MTYIAGNNLVFGFIPAPITVDISFHVTPILNLFFKKASFDSGTSLFRLYALMIITKSCSDTCGYQAHRQRKGVSSLCCTLESQEHYDFSNSF